MNNKPVINFFTTALACLWLGVVYALLVHGKPAALSAAYIGVVVYCGFSWILCMRGPGPLAGAFLLILWAIFFPLTILIALGQTTAQAFMDHWWSYYLALRELPEHDPNLMKTSALVPFLFVTIVLSTLVFFVNLSKAK